MNREAPHNNPFADPDFKLDPENGVVAPRRSYRIPSEAPPPRPPQAPTADAPLRSQIDWWASHNACSFGGGAQLRAVLYGLLDRVEELEAALAEQAD